MLTEDTNNLLPHLEFWESNECINIISHEIIIEEWNKHKVKQKKRFSDSLNTKYKHTLEVVKKEKLTIPEKLEPNIQNIDEQIEIIDNLLANSKILSVPNNIKILCSDRTISKKAPFHNKLDSTKDAYIIFSTIEHFKEENQEFLFISANKNEFGAPNNIELEIHPEIIEGFSNIKVSYFADIGRAINSLKQELPISMLPPNVDNTNELEIEDKVLIDKSKPILDQVFDYISIRQKEVSFFPLSLFSNQYPFKAKANSQPYYSFFSLTSDNQELFDLFNSVNISEANIITITNADFYKGVKDYKNKIKNILLGLTKNLIFNISNEKTRERISIRYSNETNCQCPKCSFRKFKFIDSFKNLETYNDKDILESGYVHYLIGNFTTSANKQLKATEFFTKKKQNLSKFISLFNSSKLSIFVRNNYYGDNSHDVLLEKLKKINLNYQATKLSNNEVGDFIDYLKNDKFYDNARNKIQISTSKIIDHYHSQLNGGRSSNREIWILINEYAKLESFLNGNYIIYDKFSEFNEIFKVFIEGLFASHSINESHNSRLENFDDWLINQILRYGDATTINKFYKRYKLKKIHYEKTSVSGDSFGDLIDNFFSNEGLREAFTNNCEKGNRRFWDYYNTIFKNILTLVSICDLDSNYHNLFTKKLITYLEKETFLNHLSYDYINHYINRCGKQIKRNLLKKLFFIGLKNPSCHNVEFFELLSDNFTFEKIKISKSQFISIKKMSFENCNICKAKHSETIIIPIWKMIENADYKKEIENIILEKLNEKFSFNLFYLASLFDIIKLDNVLLKKAIEESLPNDKRNSFKGMFSDIDDNRFDRVNSLLNLCFKFKVDTTTNEFEPFKLLDKYYEWLIDMNNFNYDDFQKDWISEYVTKFYFEKIYNDQLTKNKLDEILKNNFDSKLENDYINIYIRKTWEGKK
ncbi:hypothetical protein [uncultured Aquimarina sp.]|uniref:hypothetical protein n=1 Tax=uncultured Aquimarina sp. TaxID=575652 RepID=UPI00260DF997|nr:hypothetical protein [uncultured Aquimarina sp.]